MGQQIGAPGQYLPIGQFTNPASLQASQNNVPGNEVSLQPGQTLLIPPGRFIISQGLYTFLQYLDPITQTWRTQNPARSRSATVQSDGVNIRVANQLGCVIAAIVTNAGSAYAQATTTVTPSIGSSTWQAIVGGMVSVTSVAAGGGGYGLPPLVEISPPPAPGVQATAYAVMISGTVSGVTITNVGGGYVSVPEVRLIPNPTDPNIAVGITTASVSLGLFGGTAASGSIAAILCTNPGVSVASVPTLTIAGVGSAGAATAVRLTTLLGLTNTTLTGGGAGFGTAAALITSGGRPTATPANLNPAVDMSTFVPRPAQGDFFGSGGSLSSLSAIYDGGIFAGTPLAIILGTNGAVPSASVTIGTLNFGAQGDTVIIQPAV